jgi:hypothetical protein
MAVIINFSDIWDRAKHGTVLEAEVAAAEAALRSSDTSDRHLPLLIIGVARKPTAALIALVKSFLVGSRIEAERYSALRVLCRYWGLWVEFLPYLTENISPEAFERDPAVADEAFSLIGEYLWDHPDRDAWRGLVQTYDAAVAGGKNVLSKQAYSAIFDGLFGKKEALLRIARKQFRHGDEEVMNAARLRAGLTH